MAKKLVSLMLVLGMLLTLVSCGKEEAPNNPPPMFDGNGDAGSADADVPGTENTTPQATGKVALKEITSTGEIFYKDFARSYGSIYSCSNGAMFTYYNEDSYTHLKTALFPFRYDGKTGYADVHGNVVIDAIYQSGGWFSEDKALVQTTEEDSYEEYGVNYSEPVQKIIDASGNELLTIPRKYGNVSTKEKGVSSIFKNGKMLLFKEEAVMQEYYPGSYRPDSYYTTVLVINENMTTSEFRIDQSIVYHRVINTPEFCGVLTQCNDQSESGEYMERYTLYDLTGREVWSVAVSQDNQSFYTENDLTPIEGFIAENGYMNIVNEQGKWGLFDLSTETVKIPCQYDYLGAYSDGLIEVCKYDKWGYVDLNGNEVIKPAFVYANSFADGKAFVEMENHQYAVIDKSGNVVANYSGLGFTTVLGRPGYEMVTSFNKGTGIAAMTAGSKQVSFITSDGRVLLTVDDSSAAVYISDKYVFVGERMFEIVRE